MHYRYSASASARWLTCRGSLQAIENDIKSGKLPKEGTTNVHAELGTAAHALGEKALLEKKKPVDYDGQIIYSDFRVDTKMIEAVNVYVNYVKQEARRGDLKVEYRRSLEKVLGVKCGGTSDTVIIKVEKGLLHTIDYKNGRGLVEAFNNTQLFIYVLSVYHSLPKRIKRQIDKYKCTIVQPNAYHEDGPIRTQSGSIKSILGWQVKSLEPAVKEIESGKMILTASEKACEWCPRRAYCAENAAFQMELTQLEFSDFSEEPSLPEAASLSEEEINQILENGDRIIAWIKSVKMHASDLQHDKAIFEGWKIVESLGNRKLVAPGRARTRMMRLGLLREDIFHEPVMKSAAQLESELKVKLGMKPAKAKGIIDTYSERTVTGTKMVRDSSAGEPITDSAKNDFKSVKPKTTGKPRNGKAKKQTKPKRFAGRRAS